MEKTLVFTDAHRANEEQYAKLLQAALHHRVRYMVFLGDIDGAEGYRNFRIMKYEAENLGIPVLCVMGNHDHSWLNYANDPEVTDIISEGGDSDLRGKDKSAFLQLMAEFKEKITIDDVVMTHAFPKGKRISGTLGKKVLPTDPRLVKREFWHYSFGTDGTRGRGKEAYDPTVLGWNFELLTNGTGWRHMVKGHEHIPKVWVYDGGPKGGCELKRQDVIVAPSPSIIQIGDFEKGHYALLSKHMGNSMYIEFRLL